MQFKKKNKIFLGIFWASRWKGRRSGTGAERPRSVCPLVNLAALRMGSTQPFCLASCLGNYHLVSPSLPCLTSCSSRGVVCFWQPSLGEFGVLESERQ